jgi:CBS domain-containing protein
MQNVPIMQFMTSIPTTVQAAASVADAERVMREGHCHHVPVVDAENRLVGLLSSHDLLKALILRPAAELPHRASLQAKHVAEVMQRNVRTLQDSATLLDAARALRDGGLHALPVVGADNRLLGIVTTTDLAVAVADALQESDQSAQDRPAASHDDAQREISALRNVYRAVVSYLESGRGELEHTRLLQAADRARELSAPKKLDL